MEPTTPTDPASTGGNVTGGDQGGSIAGSATAGGSSSTGGSTTTAGGSAATGGGSAATGGGDGCTVSVEGAECVDNTDTDSVGSQPVEQGKAKEELAETGATETTFLLVGAATMIAGGIGFRMLPRLVGGRAAV
ncbi:LPXTG cell wall anchor domain-containing protein [Streptomyces sp. I6]|uniref:LPXTG cell wall anchor domain-containing protein n=1 Tax=Streptomyces sp. I6 TaxID=2483113 RepID=UPI002880BCDB|nr:LPXTG cell wall anchor domain-containing protein [Streptomyces sp. I6]